MPNRLTFDAWTPLSFKRSLDEDRAAAGRSWVAPTWVGDHGRRLLAYTILGAYIDNAARHFLTSNDETKRSNHREYGDAALLRAQTCSALLGDEQRWVTDGADDVTAEPVTDEAGNTVTDENGDPVLAEIDEAAAGPLRVQEWVEQWADDERFTIKMLESERNAVGLGDSVYVLGWSSRRSRVTLRAYEPGFYFPALDPMSDDEFPSRIHIAWEVDSDDGKTRIRRKTWELGPIEPVEREDGELALAEGTRVAGDRIVRDLPWSDEPAQQTCYFSDGIWTIEGDRATVDDLTDGDAEWQTNEDGEALRRVDLGIDFVPVVHVPNTIAEADHYGQSSLAVVLQILDDLANADTDLQASSATTGTPPLALSGAQMDRDQAAYQPGEIWNLGPDGKLTALDTSAQLAALAEYVDGLLGRLSINARIPAALLGRVDPSEVPSGIALSLSFGPLVSMVREMRLVRDEKYALLAKFAWRIARLGGAPDVPAEWHRTSLQFGSYLPADEQGAVNTVARLLEAKAISLETGVRILIDAGIPIEDAVAEVRRITSRDFQGANDLFDAVGDQGVVDEYLGVTRTAPRQDGPPVEPVGPPPPPRTGVREDEPDDL